MAKHKTSWLTTRNFLILAIAINFAVVLFFYTQRWMDDNRIKHLPVYDPAKTEHSVNAK